MPGHKTAHAQAEIPSSAPHSGDIRLDLISMTEWRVCDRRFRESDSRGVLGFIERHGSDYEVTTVKAPDRVTVFSGLASATASFSEPE
ncbi:hypothetical protein BH11ACT4_BH11ACT4_20950 [soil metagenome]